jgi:N-hydroxyarylamine O-acetyltransferase
LLPLPLVPGQVARQYAWSYRLAQEGGGWVLQSLHGGAWQDLYAFTLEPHFPMDFEVANHFTSTHPASRFVQTLTVQLPTPQVRYTLRGLELVEDRGGQISSRTVQGDEELLDVLADTFGLAFPAGTRFRPPEARS